MIQLSSPMRVTPASWTVPMWIEQNSRIVLRSPISSSVARRAYFLSCGTPPIALNWRDPVAAADRRPALDHAVRPDDAAGADPDRGADDAVGADLDVAGELGAGLDDRRRVDLRHRRAPTRPCAPRTSARLRPRSRRRRWRARELEDARLHPIERDVEDHLVARLDRPLEARRVDAGEVVDLLSSGWRRARRTRAAPPPGPAPRASSLPASPADAGSGRGSTARSRSRS